MTVKFYDKLPENQGIVLDTIFGPRLLVSAGKLPDRGKYHNNGTFGAGAASPSWVQLPSGIWILGFDGNDYINIDAALSSLAATTVGTWIIWAKLTDATPAAANMLLAFGDTDALEGIRIRVDTTGKITCDCYDAGVLRWSFSTDSALISDDTWFLAALAQDGVSPVLYVNGSLAAITFAISVDKTAWFSVCTGLDNGRIGCRNLNNAGDGTFLTGAVGEVFLYNRVLTATEILRHYLATKWRYGL